MCPAAGSVSSKSLMSKTRRRSCAANMPKLSKCASPQPRIRMPVAGVCASPTSSARQRRGNTRRAMRPTGRGGQGPDRGRGSWPVLRGSRPDRADQAAAPTRHGSSGARQCADFGLGGATRKACATHAVASAFPVTFCPRDQYPLSRTARQVARRHKHKAARSPSGGHPRWSSQLRVMHTTKPGLNNRRMDRPQGARRRYPRLGPTTNQ